MNDAALLARAGDLETRLALSPQEIAAAQALRYQVFFEEGGAVADPASRAAGRDICAFDAVCDHVIVVDHAAAGAPVVGAYRLLRQEAATCGYYSAAEFDVEALIARHPGLRFMELGRSCVAPGYRGKRTIEALWRGVWAYALRHRIDVMFGCASLPGVDARAHEAALAALAPFGPEPEWRAAPAACARVAASALPIATSAIPIATSAIQMAASARDSRAALRDLPPLVKGYFRLGARFGAEAVVDEAFRVIDIFVVLRVADIQARYLQHFAPEGSIAA
jgi:putative hemolysin